MGGPAGGYTTLGFLAGVHDAGAARRAGHRHHVPQRRASRQDRRDARRAVRRPGRVRPRRGVVRATSTAPTAGRSRRWPSATTCSRTRCELLPLLWGPGAPAFEGRVLDVPEAACYPRPLQERMPIIVGGSGERRTLRLVAERADGCNLFGDPANVRAQARGAARALRGGRARPGGDRGHAPLDRPGGPHGGRGGGARRRSCARARSPRRSTAPASARARWRSRSERYGALADAGVETAIVRLADLVRKPDAPARFAQVIAAFAR